MEDREATHSKPILSCAPFATAGRLATMVALGKHVQWRRRACNQCRGRPAPLSRPGVAKISTTQSMFDLLHSSARGGSYTGSEAKALPHIQLLSNNLASGRSFLDA